MQYYGWFLIKAVNIIQPHLNKITDRWKIVEVFKGDGGITEVVSDYIIWHLIKKTGDKERNN